MISRDELRQVFRRYLDHEHDPLDFQYQVAAHLLAGQSVVLQAPTGAGKTLAALLPYIAARVHKLDFPAQMMHAAPMRVLVDSFYRKAQTLALNNAPLTIDLRMQTGEAMLDPKLRGDLIYLTIDQLLSSFLGIAFSLSKRQANLNAGAVAGSYLVFDEFHLFDPDTSLATVVEILSWLNGLTPFLLMTATVSDEMVEKLKTALNPYRDPKREVAVVRVKEDDLTKIPSQANKTRTFHAVDAPMSADEILKAHRSRSIVVCNTVQRAQKMYRSLLEAGRTPENTILLHSRFLPKDRTIKTNRLLEAFGKDAWPGGNNSHDVILVATQVIEVGLDISSEVLHTEVAPASAVLQRAGRCARFEQQHGDVYVYPIPPGENGKVSYAPYIGTAFEGLCDATLEAIRDVDGQSLNYEYEADLVNKVHASADRIMLDRLLGHSFNRKQEIYETIRKADLSKAPKLIRDADSFSIIVHPNPEADRDALRLETFSLPHSTAQSLLRDAPDEGDWRFRYYEETQPIGETESYVSARWRTVATKVDLWKSPILALNPRYASYSAELGLEWRPDGDSPDPGWWQLVPRSQKDRVERSPNIIRRETYAEHISRVLKVFDDSFAKGLRYIAPRIEDELGLKQDTLLTLARFTLALHDLGKLSVEWQARAHDWQKRIGESVSGDVMLAHTHYDEALASHRETDRLKLPPHAAEGAYLANGLLKDALREQQYATDKAEQLIRPIVTAIARHHNPTTISFSPFDLHCEATNAVNESLQAIRLELPISVALMQGFRRPSGTIDLASKNMIVRDKVSDMLLYMLFVRVLRLSDQESQVLAF